MKIVIDKSEAKKTANKMLNEIEDFEGYIKKFDNVIYNINSIWQGNDALSYINLMRDEMLPKLKKMGNYLEDYATYLKKVGNSYELLDETFSSKNIDV